MIFIWFYTVLYMISYGVYMFYLIWYSFCMILHAFYMLLEVGPQSSNDLLFWLFLTFNNCFDYWRLWETPRFLTCPAFTREGWCPRSMSQEGWFPETPSRFSQPHQNFKKLQGYAFFWPLPNSFFPYFLYVFLSINYKKPCKNIFWYNVPHRTYFRFL